MKSWTTKRQHWTVTVSVNTPIAKIIEFTLLIKVKKKFPLWGGMMRLVTN